MPDRCGNVRRDRLTFELFQAEDGFEEFASSILAAKGNNSHLYFTFSYSHCVCEVFVKCLRSVCEVFAKCLRSDCEVLRSDAKARHILARLGGPP